MRSSRRFYDYDRRRAEIEADIADLRADEAEAKQRKQAEELPPLVIKPGSHWAAAAYKAGREDEYIDAMRSRYGEEW